MRRLPLDNLAPRRVCLIKPSALGDVVQALPAFLGLRRRGPRAHIAWVCGSAFTGLLEGCPGLDEVIPFPRNGGVTGMLGLAHRLWKGRFDLAIDLQGLLRSSLLAWATRASRRVGFASAREGARYLYTDLVPADQKALPAVLANWEAARAFGCTGGPPPVRLGITEKHREQARCWLAALPRPILAIHPGASWPTKRWPPEYFAALVNRSGASAVLVGGPREKEVGQAVSSRLHVPFLDLTGQTTLLQLAALLESADVMVSNDSGPMHLAAALGAPVLAPFTCTSTLRAGPYGVGHAAVATRVTCAASYRRACSSMVCMSELTPDRLWPSLLALLEKRRAA
jgi:lipopolysaccharide heptosyltransferase II